MKPNETIGGGCLCGNIRYIIDGSIGEANYCHCADCRRANGSAFNVGVRVEKSTFSLEGCTLSAFTTLGESGGEVTRYFCKTCGSPIFSSSSSNENTIHVKAGSLDDPHVVAPSHQIWTVSRVPWAKLAPDLLSFCRNKSGRRS
ncbi:MAG: GFA family protein [Alphaproteobacteria bacterium]|nr:GFA family protein [Alphaproteobacteria bacterium]